MVKQGEKEQNTLALSLPISEDGDGSEHANKDNHQREDSVSDEILKNIPKNGENRAQHILDKMTASKHITSWTKQGHLFFTVVRGSHVYDLIKNG